MRKKEKCCRNATSTASTVINHRHSGGVRPPPPSPSPPAASASDGGSSLSGRRVMIKITRNPFFNFRTLVRHRAETAAAAGHMAVAISTIAGREWSALDERRKRPYRRLAHLSRMNGGPFFVQLEHLRTFVRYPECVRDNEYFARMRGPSGAKGLAFAAAAGCSDNGAVDKAHRQPRERCGQRRSHKTDSAASKVATVAESVAISPQPDANFGGYDVAPPNGLN